jgi:hypothetical protein
MHHQKQRLFQINLTHIVIKENKEVTDIHKLFEKAKQKTEQDVNIAKKDSNKNLIYQTEQLLGVYANENGETLEKTAFTTFQKIDETVPSQSLSQNVAAVATTQSSKGDGTWDSTSSGYMYSTVYYDKVTYNSKDCVKISYATGGVNNLNSGVRVFGLDVRMGQVGSFAGANNQIKTQSFGSTTTFTMYPDSTWIPVPAVFGVYGSAVGVNMTVTFGRSSTSTWTDSFSNNLS